jgi:hypothetical protein
MLRHPKQQEGEVTPLKNLHSTGEAEPKLSLEDFDIARRREIERLEKRAVRLTRLMNAAAIGTPMLTGLVTVPVAFLCGHLHLSDFWLGCLPLLCGAVFTGGGIFAAVRWGEIAEAAEKKCKLLRAEHAGLIQRTRRAADPQQE